MFRKSSDPEPQPAKPPRRQELPPRWCSLGVVTKNEDSRTGKPVDYEVVFDLAHPGRGNFVRLPGQPGVVDAFVDSRKTTTVLESFTVRRHDPGRPKTGKENRVTTFDEIGDVDRAIVRVMFGDNGQQS